MTGKLIHLEFRSPHIEADTFVFHACRSCRNKTFTLTEDRNSSFPLLKCAACGNHIGRMGWVHDDDPALADQKPEPADVVPIRPCPAPFVLDQPPPGYTELPPGIECKCHLLWQQKQEDGSLKYFCCIKSGGGDEA